MPAKPPVIAAIITDQLIALGHQIRAHRKKLGISAITAAEAAGISRVTLHRIEKGEPAVTMGAYLNVMAVLGLSFGLVTSTELVEPHDVVMQEGWVPARIQLMDYPQLKQIAWQAQRIDTLSPLEAWDIYERNWRHVDEAALTVHERQLIDALRIAFELNSSHV